MVITVALMTLAVASGTLLTYLYDPDASFVARVCSGVCVGFSILGLICFYLALLVGLDSFNLILGSFATACAFFVLRIPAIRDRLISDVRLTFHRVRAVLVHPTSHKQAIGMAFLSLLFAIALVRFFARAVFEKNGMIWTGAVNNIGDLPLHTSMISSFAYGNNFPPEHPEFAGARLTYPFLIDFLTAVFMHPGVSMVTAMSLQTLLLMLSLGGLAYRWIHKLTKDTLTSVTALALLFLSGGLGWWLLGRDAERMGGNWLSALMNLGYEYTTQSSEGLRFGNLLETILAPQRSFQMGLPLAFIVLTLWWQSIETPPSETDPTGNPNNWVSRIRLALSTPPMRRMLGAGAITGMLPLIHTTTFGVLLGMGGCLALLFRHQWQQWVTYFAAALLVGLPQVLWLGHGSAVETERMFAWQFGWDRGGINPYWFWFKNTGLFIPALVVAMVWGVRARFVSKRLLLYYLPFLLCFIVPNLVRLMPWIWDNIKALIFWYIASVPLVALLLVHLWRKNILLRVLVVPLFVCMTLAGSLDVWRVLAGSAWIVFDRGKIKTAEAIREICRPRALILHAPINNPPVYLTGRRSLFSIPFLNWVHGLGTGDRNDEVQKVYKGGPEASNIIEKYKIDFVLVDPEEHDHLRVNDNYFVSNYQIVYQADGYTLFQTRK